MPKLPAGPHPHPSRRAIGRVLREARATANLTQAQLAEATGGKVHQTLISLIERGARALTEEVAEALARPLGLSAERLMAAKRALDTPNPRLVESSILPYTRGAGPLVVRPPNPNDQSPDSPVGLFAMLNTLVVTVPSDTVEQSPRAREQQQLVDLEAVEALRLAEQAVQQTAGMPYPGSLERLLRLKRIFELLPLLSDDAVIRVVAEVDGESAALAIDGRSSTGARAVLGPHERPRWAGSDEDPSDPE